MLLQLDGVSRVAEVQDVVVDKVNKRTRAVNIAAHNSSQHYTSSTQTTLYNTAAYKTMLFSVDHVINRPSQTLQVKLQYRTY